MWTLLYPWWLALLPLPWLARPFWPAYQESRQGLRVPFLPRLVAAAGREARSGVVLRGAFVQRLAVALVWVCALLALARPQWLEPPIERTIPLRDLLLAVDLSGSMETKDFTNAQGEKVDRLTAVKEVLGDFLAHRQGDRVGLIVFGNAPFVQVPFTEDLDVCRELLDECQVRMAGPKTSLGDAIGLAVTVFERSDAPERVLIVLTDGNDTGSQVPPEEAARVARDHKIVIDPVAVGDPRAAGEEKLDEETLKHVAAETGGTYAFAADRKQLAEVYRRLDELTPRQVKTVSYRPRVERFHWPLAVGLAITVAMQTWMLVAGWFSRASIRRASNRRELAASGAR